MKSTAPRIWFRCTGFWENRPELVGLFSCSWTVPSRRKARDRQFHGILLSVVCALEATLQNLDLCLIFLYCLFRRLGVCHNPFLDVSYAQSEGFRQSIWHTPKEAIWKLFFLYNFVSLEKGWESVWTVKEHTLNLLSRWMNIFQQETPVWENYVGFDWA